MTCKVAVAESITGGLLADMFVSVPGASAYYKGAVSPYDLDGKVKLLEVDEEHAAAVDCVSATVARQMAEGVTKQLQTDVGISTTGYAQDPNPEGISPHAFVCLFDAKKNRFTDVYVGSEDYVDRNQFRRLVAAKARSLFNVYQ